MANTLQLPIIDLSSSDLPSTIDSIHQACVHFGFFYLINHGIQEDLLKSVFDESRKFFSLPLEEKMKLPRKEDRGYGPLYAEKLDPSTKGDSKETFHIGPIDDKSTVSHLNQWPSRELLPTWRSTMESYYAKVLTAGKRLLPLMALALNIDENYFEKIGASTLPSGFLRLLHYPGHLDGETFGASAHSDYGMITLLATDGIGGLQVCREKNKEPQIWEDVHHIHGAVIVNIGDMMERWTNCLFRSTLHRVMPTGQERFSVAFFLDPADDCIVECLESCCSESNPPRFPPIRSGDYLKEKFMMTYGS
ncbi:2-oxoglutarate-Fe(II) type oxidoreductase hxnY-like isoform X1 [Impatiens glandulifera]|uniref:2-oxoglutarate-Fe(II) type oxidoreductase hxnY-like isoform X1 n=1 Tax=Impatiens glandulifera TaxID=253017 RepID=UPI001FB15275|nr:2-oxoglutarate-Fe(II) type oxidoreductase hxnY-like isoform X1 [Impatiens glandulifera]